MEHPQQLVTARIAGRIQIAMTRRRLTLHQLAVRSGVAEGTIRRILEGHDTRITTLQAVASELGLTIASLTDEKAA